MNHVTETEINKFAMSLSCTCRRPVLLGSQLQPHRLQAHALPSPRRSRVSADVVRAHSDKEASASAAAKEAGGSQSADFAALARELTGSLAAELADPQTLDKLSEWLACSHSEGEEVAPRTDQVTAESGAKKLLRRAAEHYGVPTTLTGAVDSAKHWLSSPTGTDQSALGDEQMVGRLLHRLLERYEREHGEFHGSGPDEYERLYGLAKGVLGSSVSKQVLTHLVRAYLDI